jgi:DNA invertase Pin-like site-specific DNA recombinase
MCIAAARLLAALSAGDVLLVTRLDRLARSTRDLLNVLDAVAKAGAGFRSLASAAEAQANFGGAPRH